MGNPKKVGLGPVAILGGGIIAVIGLTVIGAIVYTQFTDDATESVVVEDADALTYNPNEVTRSGDMVLAGFEPAFPDSRPCDIRLGTIPWMGNMTVIGANGGSVTMEGSRFAEAGIKVCIKRYNDYDTMFAMLENCAADYAAGKSRCRENGLDIAVIMGDSTSFWIGNEDEGFYSNILELGRKSSHLDGYRLAPVVIGGWGQSYGEDVVMGPRAALDDIEVMRGTVITGVKGDGDFNVLISMLQARETDDGEIIPINPDDTTYDPNAVNLWYVNSFDEGDKAFCEQLTSERDVVINGKRTGKKKIVTPDGTATWTPGDITVNETCGGVTRLYSTRENSGQMPVSAICINHWCEQNETMVVDLIAGALESGADIRSSKNQALPRAAKAFHEVMDDPVVDSPAKWERLYHGYTAIDATEELNVPLGGSLAWTLEDALQFYPVEGVPSDRKWFAAWETYSTEALKLWPDDLSKVLDPEQVYDPRYLAAVNARQGMKRGELNQPNFASITEETGRQVGDRTWNITFRSNSDEFGPDAYGQLEQLRRQLALSDGSKVYIHGHTDSQGDDDFNMELSERRGEAVKRWLIDNSGAGFSEERIVVVPHGESDPVADNGTAFGRAANRRVEIGLYVADSDQG